MMRGTCVHCFFNALIRFKKANVTMMYEWRKEKIFKVGDLKQLESEIRLSKMSEK